MTEDISPNQTTKHDQFISVQSLDQLGRWRVMRDDSAEIIFRSFLQEALVSNSGMSRDVHSLVLPTQHFLCRQRRRSHSKVPLGVVFGEAVVACDMPEPCMFGSMKHPFER